MTELNFDFQQKTKSPHAVKVAERIIVPIYAERSQGKKTWWFDYAVDDPKAAGLHVINAWNVLNAIKEYDLEISSCIDLFAGSGIQSVICEKLFDLKSHFIGEISKEAVSHLKKLFEDKPQVKISLQDAFEAKIEKTDLLITDYPDFTLHKFFKVQKYHDFFVRCFEARPKVIMISDSAARYFAPNKMNYGKLVGKTLESYHDYLQAMVEEVKRRFGYSLLKCSYNRHSAIWSFVDQDNVKGEIEKDPGSITGFEILY